jgi:3-hydroxyacyl-CoA dehydrogenase
MHQIKKVCVIGSGVMGAGIAAQVANAGLPVLLLDIPLTGLHKKDGLAIDAIERMKKSDPAQLMSPRNAKLITPGNTEDNLKDIADCDWIIEVIIERLDAKQDLYSRIEQFRNKDAIVSSNTSTIPLSHLVEGRSQDFKKHFVISHFFNPPRYMRLLELVKGKDTLPEVVETITDFCDRSLGKGVIACHDTPGFIANRIGTYWLQTAMLEAIEQKITVEEADAIFSKPFGIPKTGVFALMDLVGLDLMPLIGKSMKDALPTSDAYVQSYQEPELVQKMIADGYTGRKGKGGFYRLLKEGDKKIKQAIDLQTGEYAAVERSPRLASLEVAKSGLKRFLTYNDRGAKYGWSVISKVLAYAASLVPEIADSIEAVDEAMRMGYNWKWGPFELIDKLGPSWFAKQLEAENRPVPDLIKKVGEGTFYKIDNGQLMYFGTDGLYHAITRRPGVLLLSDIKRTSKPIAKNASACLWDIGDGVVCFEFTSKSNSLDLDIMDMFTHCLEIIPKQYKALVIHNEGANFSVGANLAMALFAMNIGLWPLIGQLVERGQKALQDIKFAPFPVVGAPSGMALGGGCEILLHCDAIQAHAESYIGQAEAGVGLVPAWGGCTELMARWLHDANRAGGAMVALGKVFELIGLAQISRSAEQARDMLILRKDDRITMNRDRLLADAKARALELVDGYQPPKPYTFNLPGGVARAAFALAVKGLVLAGKASAYDAEIAKKVAIILSGGDTDISETVTEEDILKLEREEFMQLVHNPHTWARIEYTLETGKPLRN